MKTQDEQIEQLNRPDGFAMLFMKMSPDYLPDCNFTITAYKGGMAVGQIVLIMVRDPSFTWDEQHELGDKAHVPKESNANDDSNDL